MLKLADPARSYYVYADESNMAIGAVLLQEYDGKMHPIAYTSRVLKPLERNYATHDKELLAIVYALLQWKQYLYGESPTIFTDHRPLIHIQKQKELTGRQARWIEKIAPFNAQITYVDGKANVIADMLSRPPITVNTVAIGCLPQGGLRKKLKQAN